MEPNSQEKAVIDSIPSKMTQAQFARTIGVTAGAVSRGLKRGRIIIGKDGYLDKSQVTAWFATRNDNQLRAHTAGRKPNVPSDAQMDDFRELGEIKLEKARVELQLQKRELEKSNGELVSRVEVKRAISDFSRLLSSKLTNFPSRYGMEIAAAAGCDARPLIGAMEKFMRAQIEELSAVKPTIPG